MKSERDQFDFEDLNNSILWDYALENMKSKQKLRANNINQFQNKHKSKDTEHADSKNSRIISESNGYSMNMPFTPIFSPSGNVVQSQYPNYMQPGIPIAYYPGYTFLPEQMPIPQQQILKMEQKLIKSSNKKPKTKKKKSKIENSTKNSKDSSSLEKEKEKDKSKLTENKSKDSKSNETEPTGINDEDTQKISIKNEVNDSHNSESLKSKLSILNIDSKRITAKCQDMFIKIININNSDLDKWDYAISIQKIIEKSLSSYEISSTMKLLNQQGFQKFANSKFGNYILQSIIKKLTPEDLISAWENLSTISIMVSEYGNRVIQLSLDLLLNYKIKSYEDIVIASIAKNYDFLAYNKYGTYILQNYLCHRSSPNIESLVNYIEENFYSLSFHVNGIHLIKRYIIHIKDNKEEVTKIFERFVKPYFPFLIQDKYSHYLVCLMIEEFKHLRKDILLHYKENVKCFKDKYLRRVTLLFLELYDEDLKIYEGDDKTALYDLYYELKEKFLFV